MNPIGNIMIVFVTGVVGLWIVTDFIKIPGL